MPPPDIEVGSDASFIDAAIEVFEDRTGVFDDQIEGMIVRDATGAPLSIADGDEEIRMELEMTPRLGSGFELDPQHDGNVSWGEFVESLLDRGQRKTIVLELLDHSQAEHMVRVVRRRRSTPVRGLQEPLGDVIPNRAAAHAGLMLEIVDRIARRSRLFKSWDTAWRQAIGVAHAGLSI